MQKCTVAMRMVACGKTIGVVDVIVWMGESTCLQATMKLSRTMVQVFGPQYLREANSVDTKKLLTIGATKDFVVMLD